MKRTFSFAGLGFAGLLSAGNFLHRERISLPLVPPLLEEVVLSPEEEAIRLNRDFGYTVSAEDLVALSRMLYFEGIYDPKVKSEEEQENSFAAIAEVILNRYLFDTCSEDSPVANPFCEKNGHSFYGGDEGLRGIIMKKSVNSKGREIHQFSSLYFHPDFFAEESLHHGLNDSTYYGRKKKGGEIQTLDEDTLQLAYQTLIEVLAQRGSRQSSGALYYKNSDEVDVVWNGVPAFSDVRSDCSLLEKALDERAQNGVDQKSSDVDCRIEQPFVHYYVGSVGSHDYYTVKEDPSQRREVVFDNRRGNVFVNGRYDPDMSQKKYQP